MIINKSTGPEQWIIIYNDNAEILSIFEGNHVDLDNVAQEFPVVNIAVYDRDDADIQAFREMPGSIQISSASKEILTFTPGTQPQPGPETSDIIPIYVHIDITGGDGEDVVGIKNDGTDSCTITATIRSGIESDSTIINAVSSSWRVNIRNLAGSIADVVKITFVNGQVTFNYTTLPNAQCGTYFISPEDVYEEFEMGGTTYKFTLVQRCESSEATPTEPIWPCFKVYREL